MSIKKMLKEELKKEQTPSANKVLPSSALTGKKSEEINEIRPVKAYNPRLRFGVILTAAVLTVLLAIGCGAAIPVIIKRLNSLRVTERALRYTEVPDGWIGVYDLDDLLLINEPSNKEAKFILMNDIEIPDSAYAVGGIFEGGLQPLGIYRSETPLDQMINIEQDRSFSGEFNGNGHTVSNLKLVSTVYRYSGGAYHPHIIAGLFGYGNAEIMHLGVENVEVRVEIGTDLKHNEIFVGSVVANADVVAGCYAKDIEVYFSNAVNPNELVGVEYSKYGRAAIGGLCGYADYVDSCFVKNAVIKSEYTGGGTEIMVGGVCGTSLACITSYFEGKIIANNGNYAESYIDDVCAMIYPAYIPKVLSESAMKALLEKLTQAGFGKDSFEYKKFAAYYLRYDLDSNLDIYPQEYTEKFNQLIMKNVSDFYSVEVKKVSGTWYLLDGYSNKIEDIDNLTEILMLAFDNDAKAIEKFCADNNIKCGKLYCHSFDKGESVTRDALAGFDFEYIWETTEDGVIQKIFVE